MNSLYTTRRKLPRRFLIIAIVGLLATVLPWQMPLPVAYAATDCSAVSQIPQQECEALLALYNSTNGSEWETNDNWNQTNLPCFWNGVICSQEHVKFLRLPSNKLNGNIPPELGNLTNLETLELSTNQLTGNIPPELSNLLNLQTLSLQYNQLTGSIPSELSNLPKLNSLYLSVNALSGNIPPELGNLIELQTLYLNHNDLSGSIPDSLGNTSLVTLKLSNNNLIGNIPTSLGNTNLGVLDLSYNHLSGSIPSTLGNLNLRDLRLNANQLTGSIPSSLGNLINLGILNLGSNRLSGSIPSSLGNLTNLQMFLLSKNLLSGSIPPELGNLVQAESIALSDNQLSGSIPPELGNSNMTRLRSLYLSYNKLTGSIPAELSNLPILYQLGLNDNQLSGTLPPELGSTTLGTLDLSNNQLEGSIPPEFGNFAQLKRLSLANNQLSGNIPPELCYYGVESVDLRNNQLSGSIPPELGKRIGMSLLLGQNKLTGNIPPELGKIVYLEHLDLSGNQLSGSIPSELGSLLNLRSLLLNNNQLNGTPPASLTKLSQLPVYSNMSATSGLDLGYNQLTTTGLDTSLETFLTDLDPDWKDTQFLTPATPTLTSITPSTVAADSENVSFVIRGEHFLDRITIKIGYTMWGTPNYITRESSTTIFVTIPKITLNEGVYDLDITSNGTPVTLPDALTVVPSSESQPMPHFTSISPTTAAADAGDVSVVINGENLHTPVTARIGAVPLISVTLESSTTLRGIVPVASLGEGTYDLFATSDGYPLALWDAFTIMPVSTPTLTPQINDISTPEAVANADNVSLVIYGQNLQMPVTVEIGGVPLHNVTLESDTAIHAVVPVASLQEGTHDLVITSGGQTLPLPDDVTFTVTPRVSPTRFRVMIVLACDNDLEASCEELFNQLELAMVKNPDLRIVVLWDGQSIGDSSYYLIQPDEHPLRRATYTEGVHRFSQGELNTGSPNTLVEFAAWAQSQYPGRYKFLSFVGHGGGWAANLHPAQPRHHSSKGGGEFIGGMLWDDHAVSTLATAPLARAMKWITMGEPLDVVYLDACLMGAVEVVAEIVPYTRYVVAHENITWSIHPYAAYLEHATSTATPESLAKHIAEVSRASWSQGHPNQISVIKTDNIVTLLNTLDVFAIKMQEALPSSRTAIDAVLKQTMRVDQNSDMVINEADAVVDLRDFLHNLTEYSDIPNAVKFQATSVINALDRTVVQTHTRNGYPWKGRNLWKLSRLSGLSLYFPVVDEWKRGFYHADSLPRFATMTHWDEFIRDWHADKQAPAAPTEPCEGDCPSGPISLEELRLNVAPGYDTMRLSWTPALASTATNYRLTRIVSGTDEVQTTLLPIQDTDTAYFDTQNVKHGLNYCYRIEALDSDNNVIAHSKQVCVTAGEIVLWIPDIYAAPGTSVFVPVNIRNASGLRLASGDIVMQYDPAILTLKQVFNTSLTHGSYQFQVDPNASQPGVLKMSVLPMGAEPPVLYDSGSLVWVEFQVNGQVGSTSAMNLQEQVGANVATNLVVPNDSDPLNPRSAALSVQSGSVSVAETYVAGDVNGDGQVQAIDAYLGLQLAIGQSSPTAQQLSAGDVNGNGMIDVGDTPLILYYAVHGAWPVLSERVAKNATQHASRSLLYSSYTQQTGTPLPAILSLDTHTLESEGTTNVSLRVAHLSNLAAAEFLLTYDPLVIDGVEAVDAAGIGSQFHVEFVNDRPGVVRIAMVNKTPISGGGDLLQITVRASDQSGSSNTNPLTFSTATIYDQFGRNMAISSVQQQVTWGTGLLTPAEPQEIYLPLIQR